MPGGGEVDADLLRPAGDEVDFDEGGAARAVAMEDAAFGAGRSAAGRGGVDGPGGGVRDRTDRRVEGEAVLRDEAPYERPVALADGAFLERVEEGPTGEAGAGEEDDAGGGAAEAMDGSGRGLAGKAEANAAQEGVLEMLRAGEDGKAGRFGDGEDVGVPMEEGEPEGDVRLAPGGTSPFQELPRP